MPPVEKVLESIQRSRAHAGAETASRVASAPAFYLAPRQTLRCNCAEISLEGFLKMNGRIFVGYAVFLSTAADDELNVVSAPTSPPPMNLTGGHNFYSL